MNFEKVKDAILKFRDDRDRKQFHNPKDLAEAISIESWELLEKFLRKSQEESRNIAKNNPDVKDEVADIFNYLILFADNCNIDLESSILDKIKHNNKKYSIEKAKGRSDKYTKL